jgi:2',3'-cyclic-nucleotide 2'-phosphodiesterase (5'-nucleotidase family)
MIVRKLIIAFTLLFSFNSFSQKSDTTIIVLLHNNDIHGYIDNFAKIKPIVDSIRQVNKNTLLIAAGDLFSGNPVVDKYTKRGYPIIDLMNKMGYDLTCLGNHEFDYGQDTLKARISEANFPFICANIYTDKSVLNNFKPYIYFSFGDTKITFVSVLAITKDGFPESLITNLYGLGFSNPFAELKEYSFLKDSASIVVGLTHLGYKGDKVVRKKNKYINIIIGGHSHTLLDPYINGPKRPIFQVGSYNRDLGEIKLYIVDNKIVKIENKIYNIKENLKTDSELKKLIDNYNNNPFLSEDIAYLPKKYEKNDLVKLMANSYKDTLKCDIGIMNYGGVRLDSLNKGNVKRKNIYELDPFNNELYKANLTLSEIKSLIKSTYNSNGKLLIKVVGFGDISYDWNKKTIKNISIKDLNNNELLDENKTYSIAISSYVATKYNFIGKDKLSPTGVLSNDAIFNYLNKNSTFKN